MSTTPSTNPFAVTNLQHLFAIGVGKVRAGLQFIENKAIPAFQKADEAAEAPTALLAGVGVPYASQALVFERAIDAAAGELLAAVHTLDNVDPNTPTVDLKISLDSYKTFKAFIQDQKANLAAIGVKL